MDNAGDTAVTKATLDPALKGDRLITRQGQPGVVRAGIGKLQGMEGSRRGTLPCLGKRRSGKASRKGKKTVDFKSQAKNVPGRRGSMDRGLEVEDLIVLFNELKYHCSWRGDPGSVHKESVGPC